MGRRKRKRKRVSSSNDSHDRFSTCTLDFTSKPYIVTKYEIQPSFRSHSCKPIIISHQPTSRNHLEPIPLYTPKLLKTIMARSFYGDDEFVETKPGYKSEISKSLKEKESLHGNISFVEGMGVRTTPYLEKLVNRSKTYLEDKFSIYGAEVGTQISAARNEVKAFATKANDLIKEPDMLMEVTFPTLVSAIMVNNRAAPLRILFPITVSAAAFRIAMPKTYEASRDKVLEWEKETYPDTYKQQQDLVQSGRELWEQFRQVREQSKLDLQQHVHNARVYLTEVLKDED
ncbi:hypothetical protein SBP28_003396 [Candidozyma auris]